MRALALFLVLSAFTWMLTDVARAKRPNAKQPNGMLVGVAGSPTGRLPYILPKPRHMPRFERNAPSEGLDAGGNYLDEHVVRSTGPLGKYGREHELFHTLDHDELDLPTRVAIAKIIAPRRAHEVVDDESWWGETGAAAGGHAGIAELAADYYAAAATNLRPKRRLPGGVVVSEQDSAYVPTMRAKRLQGFRELMDRWARDHMMQAPPQQQRPRAALARRVAEQQVARRPRNRP